MTQNKTRYIHFSEEKVIVEVPSDDIRVIRTKLNLKDVVFDDAEGITPFRVVINIEIQRKNQNDEFINLSDGETLPVPITLWVHYNLQDFKDATNGLKLVCWNGKRWILFTKGDRLEKHPEAAPESGGWYKVDIYGWGDPAIVWAD